MAFGTFFKNIITGAKKILPYVGKAFNVVSKVAPIIGNAVGGTAGEWIGKVGNLAGKVSSVGGTGGVWKLPTKINNGARFGVPALKQ